MAEYGRTDRIAYLADSKVSNEPGLYLEGRFGIRIENLMLVVEKAAICRGSSGAASNAINFLNLVLYCIGASAL